MSSLIPFSLFESYWSAAPRIKVISPYLPDAPASGVHVLGEYFEADGQMLFARILENPIGAPLSDVEFGVTRFGNRERDLAVYVTPRSSSSFNGSLDTLLILLDEGYDLYPVDELCHSDTVVKPLTTRPVRDKKLIVTGQFRAGLSLNCQFDSSFAFFAVPNGEPAPSPDLLDEFSNWLNGYSYGYELLCARPDKSVDGIEKYIIEVIDDGPVCHSWNLAKESAMRDLRDVVRSRFTTQLLS